MKNSLSPKQYQIFLSRQIRKALRYADRKVNYVSSFKNRVRAGAVFGLYQEKEV